MSEVEELKAQSALLKLDAFAHKRALDGELIQRDLHESGGMREGFSCASAVDGLELFLEVRFSGGIVPALWRWRIVHRAHPDLSESFIDSGRFINLPLIGADSEPGFAAGIAGVIDKYRDFLAWEASLERSAYRNYFYRFEEERKYAEAAKVAEIIAVMETHLSEKPA